MSSLDAVTAWIENYRKAWESNDPRDIGDLFAEDGAYFTEPFAKPWLGREAIVENWIKNADQPGSTCDEIHGALPDDDRPRRGDVMKALTKRAAAGHWQSAGAGKPKDPRRFWRLEG